MLCIGIGIGIGWLLVVLILCSIAVVLNSSPEVGRDRCVYREDSLHVLFLLCLNVLILRVLEPLIGLLYDINLGSSFAAYCCLFHLFPVM